MTRVPDWSEELSAAVTVTAADGTILSLNAAAREVFARDGGAALVGKNVLDCHPEPARQKTAALYQQPGRANHYTIKKNGRKKIIHQLPWTVDGRFAGVVELSIPIPDELPHFDRDAR
jgi:transcriptional regulator with PAS, ATPase and Fis domain